MENKKSNQTEKKTAGSCPSAMNCYLFSFFVFICSFFMPFCFLMPLFKEDCTCSVISISPMLLSAILV